MMKIPKLHRLVLTLALTASVAALSPAQSGWNKVVDTITATYDQLAFIGSGHPAPAAVSGYCDWTATANNWFIVTGDDATGLGIPWTLLYASKCNNVWPTTVNWHELSSVVGGKIIHDYQQFDSREGDQAFEPTGGGTRYSRHVSEHLIDYLSYSLENPPPAGGGG